MISIIVHEGGKAELLGAIARAWTHDCNSHKTMDADLVTAAGEEIVKQLEQWGINFLISEKEVQLAMNDKADKNDGRETNRADIDADGGNGGTDIA